MSLSDKPGGQGAWRIFRWPLTLGVASTVGLVSALVGDGLADVLSWLCLGGMLVVMSEAWRRADRRTAEAARRRLADQPADPQLRSRL